MSHDLPLSASSLHRKRKARDELELASATKVARAINKDLAEKEAQDRADGKISVADALPATALTADQIR